MKYNASDRFAEARLVRHLNDATRASVLPAGFNGGLLIDTVIDFAKKFPQMKFIDPKLLADAIVIDARTLPSIPIINDMIGEFYLMKLTPNLNNIYVNAPAFFEKNFIRDPMGFELYQKYYYLICFIKFVAEKLTDDQFQANYKMTEINAWVNSRRDPNIDYIIVGPTENTVFDINFEEHYSALISSSTSMADIVRYQQLTTAQTTSDDVLNILSFLQRNPNTYFKNPDEAKKYTLNIDSSRDVIVSIDKDNNLLFDCGYVNFGDTTESNDAGRLDEIQNLNPTADMDSRIATKKIERIFQMYSRVKVLECVIAPDAFITSLDIFPKVFIVFQGVLCSERNIYNTIENNYFKIGGCFKRTNRGYEFQQDVNAITYKTAKTRVSGFKIFISLDPNARNVIMPNEFPLKFTKFNVYQHPYTVNEGINLKRLHMVRIPNPDIGTVKDHKVAKAVFNPARKTSIEDRWKLMHNPPNTTTSEESNATHDIAYIDTDSGTINGKFFRIGDNGTIRFTDDKNQPYTFPDRNWIKYNVDRNDLCLINLLKYDGAIKRIPFGSFMYSEQLKTIQNLDHNTEAWNLTNLNFRYDTNFVAKLGTTDSSIVPFWDTNDGVQPDNVKTWEFLREESLLDKLSNVECYMLLTPTAAAAGNTTTVATYYTVNRDVGVIATFQGNDSIKINGVTKRFLDWFGPVTAVTGNAAGGTTTGATTGTTTGNAAGTTTGNAAGGTTTGTTTGNANNVTVTPFVEYSRPDTTLQPNQGAAAPGAAGGAAVAPPVPTVNYKVYKLSTFDPTAQVPNISMYYKYYQPTDYHMFNTSRWNIKSSKNGDTYTVIVKDTVGNTIKCIRTSATVDVYTSHLDFEKLTDLTSTNYTYYDQSNNKITLAYCRCVDNADLHHIVIVNRTLVVMKDATEYEVVVIDLDTGDVWHGNNTAHGVNMYDFIDRANFNDDGSIIGKDITSLKLDKMTKLASSEFEVYTKVTTETTVVNPDNTSTTTIDNQEGKVRSPTPRNIPETTVTNVTTTTDPVTNDVTTTTTKTTTFSVSTLVSNTAATMTKYSAYSDDYDPELSNAYKAFRVDTFEPIMKYWTDGMYVNSILHCHLPTKHPYQRLPFEELTVDGNEENTLVYQLDSQGKMVVRKKTYLIKQTGLFEVTTTSTKKLKASESLYVSKKGIEMFYYTPNDADEAVIPTDNTQKRFAIRDEALTTKFEIYVKGKPTITNVVLLETNQLYDTLTKKISDKLIPIGTYDGGVTNNVPIYINGYEIVINTTNDIKYKIQNISLSKLVDKTYEYKLAPDKDLGDVIKQRWIDTIKYSNRCEKTLDTEIFQLGIPETVYAVHPYIKYIENSFTLPKRVNEHGEYITMANKTNQNIMTGTVNMYNNYETTKANTGTDLRIGNRIGPQEEYILESMDSNMLLIGNMFKQGTIDDVAIRKDEIYVVPKASKINLTLEFT